MGPISKYNDFSRQLDNRKFDVDLFLNGVQRIIRGMGKKLIIADGIGSMVDSIFTMNDMERTVVMAWMGIGGYLIQLYYDFSGYSDMAIGIGQLFGFYTPENFNFPYISRSATEFWNRWHITLGEWMKNYLYTPIFRKLQEKDLSIRGCDILALLGVWLFAGVWHGVGWKFVLYGIFWFVFIATERMVENYFKQRRKRLKIKKKPETLGQKFMSHLYFIIILVVGQLIFRSESITSFASYFKSMIGLAGNGFIDMQTLYYGKQNIILFLIGGILCFPIFDLAKKELEKRGLGKVIDVIKPVGYVALMVVSISFAMGNTYQAEFERKKLQMSYNSLDDYLESLEMIGEANPFEEVRYARIAQLTQRSNQFNLRTIRYTEDEIERITKDDKYITLYYTLCDKFGDHGLVSVLILKKLSDREAFIDTWLMSCRVLKRGMEEFVVNEMVRVALQEGLEVLRGEYIPTAKNAMVKDIYDRMRFFKETDGTYSLKLNEYVEKKTYIKKVN